ncbi:hypothetical protein K2X30_01340 [bacterium]|nr:hypothetical protein [bacterium]
MKNKIVGLLFLFSTPAFAYDFVKIYSGPCSAPSRPGTGIGFKKGGKSYVITSQIAVAPEGCQWIATQSIPKKEVKIVASDWGTGLALLSTEATPEFDSWVDWDDLQKQIVIDSSGTGGMSVKTIGYPSQSALPVTDARGVILVDVSNRTFIPQIPSVIEILGAHADRAMVGSLVADETNHWLGVLSQEYLVLNKKGATLPMEWGADSVQENQIQTHLLVTPAKAVTDWTNSILNGTRPTLTRVEGGSGKTKILAGSLIFTEDCTHSGKTGGDPTLEPIGGTDPVGIGGDIDVVGSCATWIDLAPASAQNPVLPQQKSWHDRTVASLSSGKGVSRIFIHRDASNSILIHSFGSIEQYFKIFSTTDAEAVVFAPNSAHANAKKAQDYIRDSRRFMLFISDLDYAFIARIDNLLTVLQSEQRGYVKASDFESLLDKNGTYKISIASLSKNYPNIIPGFLSYVQVIGKTLPP